MKNKTDIHRLQTALLAHYDQKGRSLPWRIRPEDKARGIVADPYAVWLSEIMLQQTTVPHATPYWQKFLSEFPTVEALAEVDRDRVLTLWAGLGYYARARNLHKCAQTVRDDYNGEFPQTEAELLKLPGIGPYTAATIAAICFDEPTNVVDGNVERVISRMFKVDNPLPRSRPKLRKLAGTLASPDRPGDYGQAIMDLGATLCTPRSPICSECPWNTDCLAHAAAQEMDYPKKIKKAKQPIRYGAIFVLRTQTHVLLERRPDNGLLGGMMGFPGSAWGDKPKAPLSAAPIIRNWEKRDRTVKHVFTHFELRLDVYTSTLSDTSVTQGDWVLLDDISNYAVPTVMKKVFKTALAD